MRHQILRLDNIGPRGPSRVAEHLRELSCCY
jgi:hypothetical protein